MTKADLVAAVAAKASLKQKDSAVAVSAVFDAITEALKKGELLERDDNILIKASHGMGFDKVVEFLKENE